MNQANWVSIDSAKLNVNTDFTAGISGSMIEVTNPHAKKSVVTHANAAVVDPAFLLTALSPACNGPCRDPACVADREQQIAMCNRWRERAPGAPRDAARATSALSPAGRLPALFPAAADTQAL
jgi:hypothetical protein